MFNNTWLKTNKNIENFVEKEGFGLNLNYYEFIVMIPYVRFKDAQYNDDGPYCYLPVLYLNSLAAVVGGRVFWEFNKELAHFSVQPGDFTVLKFSTRTKLLSGKTEATASRQPADSIPNFEKIKPILQLPVIEHGPLGYVSSIYHISLEKVDIAPTELDINNLGTNFLPTGILASPPITQSPLGAFLIDYDWKLSYIKFLKF